MEDPTCPLCVEPLDLTDLLHGQCDCGFQLCLWCYNRLLEEDQAARCPGCRTTYNRARSQGQKLDPKQLEEISQRKGKREDRRKSLTGSKSRKDLANMRVVQRNLVYVVGLSLDLCHEDTLRGPDYFGQFGKIVKVSVSRSGPYGANSTAKHGPSGSAYVTFRQPDDARKCIAAVHGATWDGKQVKACYGTTKYCNAFLKGIVCNNADCLYLHAEAMDEDSYTKEQTKSAKFVSLVHAVSMASPAARAAAAAAQHAMAPQRLASAASVSALEEEDDSHDSMQVTRSLSSATSWAARAAAGVSVAAVVQPPAPPAPFGGTQAEEEWPTLPSAGSMALAGASSDALPPDTPQGGSKSRRRSQDGVAVKAPPPQKVAVTQWPALSCSPGSSWASAAEHLRSLPSQGPMSGAGATPSSRSPSCHPEGSETPRGSDGPGEGSEAADDMTHGSGDDVESTERTPVSAAQAGSQQAQGWPVAPLRSQSRFEFARGEAPEPPAPFYGLPLPPPWPPTRRPGRTRRARAGTQAWPVAGELARAGCLPASRGGAATTGLSCTAP